VVKVRQGPNEHFDLMEADAHRLLVELLTRLPWVLSGFDSRRERSWKADRGEVLARVEEQKQQIQALPPEARRPTIEDKIRRAEEQADTRLR
jgi:hypothetical protein